MLSQHFILTECLDDVDNALDEENVTPEPALPTASIPVSTLDFRHVLKTESDFMTEISQSVTFSLCLVLSSQY